MPRYDVAKDTLFHKHISVLQVMKTQTAVRKSRGFGFVCFTNAAAADNAQREMNNSELQVAAVPTIHALPTSAKSGYACMPLTSPMISGFSFGRGRVVNLSGALERPSFEPNSKDRETHQGVFGNVDAFHYSWELGDFLCLLRFN